MTPEELQAWVKQFAGGTLYLDTPTGPEIHQLDDTGTGVELNQEEHNEE